MKKSRDSLLRQRKVMDERLGSLHALAQSPRPRLGWLKAIRECLGLSSERLGKRMQVAPNYILKLEKREQSGATSLATLAKAAEAMDCKLVYAVVPAADDHWRL